MTYETAFKKLKEKFANVESAKLDDMAIQFTLSDEDCGGTFYAEVKSGILNVEPYDYKDNDAIVDVTKAALTKILENKLSIDKAIENGDLTVKGNLEKIHSVANAIKITAAEAPAEKASKTVKTEKAAKTVKTEKVAETPKTVKTEKKEETPKTVKAPAAKKAAALAASKAPTAKKPAAPAVSKAPAAKKSAAKKTTK